MEISAPQTIHKNAAAKCPGSYVDCNIEVPNYTEELLLGFWLREFGVMYDPTMKYTVYYIMGCTVDSNCKCIDELIDIVVELCIESQETKCYEMSIHQVSVYTYNAVSQFIGRVPCYEKTHNLLTV